MRDNVVSMSMEAKGCAIFVGVLIIFCWVYGMRICENGYRSGRKSIMSLIVFSLRPRNLTADATEILRVRMDFEQRHVRYL